MVDAVFTLAMSVQKLIDEKCSNSSKEKRLCDELFPYDGTKLVSILRSTTFRNG